MHGNNPPIALTHPVPTLQPPTTELLVQVVKYVVAHLHIDLSASILAKRFSLPENVLSVCFRTHTGIALDQFVLRRRIECALHLLKNSKHCDSAIATRIGLGTAAAFQAVFFNYVGILPIEYRNRQPQKQPAASRKGRKRPCKSESLTQDVSRGWETAVLAVQ